MTARTTPSGPAGSPRSPGGQVGLHSDGTAPLLEVSGLVAAYGPYRALFGVSLRIEAGATQVLVGPNGAGKSTVLRAVSGLLDKASGTVLFAGRNILGWPAWRIARAGLGHVAEGRSVFSSISVQENLALAMTGLRGWRSRGRYVEGFERAYEVFPVLAERRHQMAGTLSGGEQRMLSLAKLVAIEHKLVMVDELSLGLSPAMVDEVYGSLVHLKQMGTALLIVEQHPQRVMEIADRVAVLARGQVTAEGTPDDVRSLVETLIPAP